MYCFQIAGLIFQITIPIDVASSDAFRPFVKSRREPDCAVYFVEKEHLYNPKGKKVAQTPAFGVIECFDGTWVRSYGDGQGKNNCVALGRMVEDGSVLVEFVPEAKKLLSDMQQVFFYIAMEEQLLQHGRWILHSSCVATSLGAILFVGSSGIGKTTQAELWEKYRGSKVLNGDRTIVYEQDGMWYAAGSPYAGSSKRYVNESAPITLVVLLEQGTDNRVQALTPGQAFRRLYPHLTVNDWNPWYVETITNQLEQFVRKRPVVHFSCTPDERAVDVLWGELTKEVDHG